VRVGIAGQPVADWHFPNIVPSNGDAARVGREPRLTAAECDVGIASGQNIQAGALINPELSYEQGNSFGSGRYRGTRSAETTLQISQLFELFGKRDARIATGRAALDTATIQRKAVRLEVLSETAIAFLGVLGHQRRIQILDEHISAIDRLTPLL
jgi:cobalt-zinc-cadmium efflux system outer membrane protein